METKLQELFPDPPVTIMRYGGLSLEACVFYQRMSLVWDFCNQSLQDLTDNHHHHHNDVC